MTHRYPVLLWRDQQGGWTAALAEDPLLSAYAESATAAAFQIKEFMLAQFDEDEGEAPKFGDAKLEWIKVEVRPAFHIEKRRYPSKYGVTMRLPVVHGVQESGMRVASLPTLGFLFYFQEAAQLNDMVAHYVQLIVGDEAPRNVARCLPPSEVRLEDIVVRHGEEPDVMRDKPSLETVQLIADALGDRGLRRSLSRAFEREAQVAEVQRRLSAGVAAERASLLLVGERGCGKTAVLVDAVRALERDTPSLRVRTRHWLTSGSRLIAGMQYLGQWQERLEAVIVELAAIGGVLCIASLRDLVRLGGDGPSSGLAAFLAPYLARAEVQLVVEATPGEVEACRRLLPGFVEMFAQVPLPPFDAAQAQRVLDKTAQALSAQNGVLVEPAALAAVYSLHRRFMPYVAFPGHASGFLRACVDAASLQKLEVVSRDFIIRRFAHDSGVGERLLRDEVPLHVAEVAAGLERRVVGQSEACAAVANVVTSFKAGMVDAERPLAVLLMCGPTGVGKTELARQLGRCLFDGADSFEERFVRLDMSEYGGWDATWRLLGTPGEPSELIKRIRRQPFCVLLVDEIEKANAAVFDVLLSVLDDGQIKDALGELTTFRSAVIVMTSNLGAEALGSVGFVERPQSGYVAAVESFFRPEFFNRLDAILQFRSLGPAEVQAITRLELAALERREGLEKRRLKLRWDEALVAHVASAGYDARLGARPLQRTVESLIVTPLARWLVEHGDLEGRTLELHLTAGGLEIRAL